MQIAVLSDTHLRAGRSLPTFVWDHLLKADLILRAGDLTYAGLVEELALIAPLKAVRGNCDGWDVNLPEQESFSCGRFKFGLIHGHQGKGKSTPERALQAFADDPVNVIVFGHSHTPLLKWQEGVLLFNPGSPTDKRREPRYSFGWITIEDKNLDARHLYF